MDNATRKKLNSERLQKIDVSIRSKVAAVISDLEGHSQQPLIATEVWRSSATQLHLYNIGNSKVTWGFHCATDKQGNPASLAADIIDANKAWGASPDFWLQLGASAESHGLGWGGRWGLVKNLSQRLTNCMVAKDWSAIGLKFGWDVAHIETTNVSIAEARAGKR